MCSEYAALVYALKNLEQPEDETTEEPVMVQLPMAEDEWYTRQETVSYGTVRLDFEADSLTGDDLKQSIAYEGSVDLYSLVREGAGWVSMIQATLTAHCGANWYLNLHAYERDTGLYHWEWAFQVEG